MDGIALFLTECACHQLNSVHNCLYLTEIRTKIVLCLFDFVSELGKTLRLSL